MIISVTKHNFAQEIEQSTKPVVIDVFATWCGPCQHMMPVFEELAQELGNRYTFAKLNVDESREIAIDFSITQVPTFLFIKDGKAVGRELGYMNKEDLRLKIEEYLN